MKKKLPRKFISRPKVAEIQKSPNIFRFITESRFLAITFMPQKELIVGFVCGCLVVGITFSSLRLLSSVKEYNVVLAEKQTLLAQRTYWQSVTKQFPAYRDAHFRLGVLAYQEGNKAEATEEVQKALNLDPSFMEARLFFQKINK